MILENVNYGDLVWARISIFNHDAGTFRVSILVERPDGILGMYTSWISNPVPIAMALNWQGVDVAFIYDQQFEQQIFTDGLRTTILAQFFLTE